MPGFYNSLDVFLCASSIEGIPAPPLEALACGVPVVVPQGVGLLDDLPDLPGIWRYPAGELSGLVAALRQVLDTPVDREALRAATVPYVAANWAADHEAAFTDLLNSGYTPERESDAHGGRGVYYVAYGDPARKCARASIASFKHFHPRIPVCLVGTEGGLGEDVFVPYAERDIAGRTAKLAINDLAPREWGQILYLDADTEVIAPVDFLFDLLSDGWEMCICKDIGPNIERMQRSDNKDEMDCTIDMLGGADLLAYNGGVFAYQRNDRTAAFFKSWQEEWQRWGKRDQAALLRAQKNHPVKLYLLGHEWNTLIRPGTDLTAEMSAGILHYPMTARRWHQKIYHRLDSREAFEALRKQGVKV